MSNSNNCKILRHAQGMVKAAPVTNAPLKIATTVARNDLSNGCRLPGVPLNETRPASTCCSISQTRSLSREAGMIG